MAKAKTETKTANPLSADVPSTPAAKAPRPNRSMRRYIDATGAVIDTLDGAVGGYFALLNPDKSVHTEWKYVPNDGPTIDGVLRFSKAQDLGAWTMGSHTKLGNEANTIFNPPEGQQEGGVDEAAVYVGAFFESEDWARERGGPRTDLDKLAQAIASIETDLDIAKFRPKLDDAGFTKQMMAVPEYADAYKRLTSKTLVSREAAKAALMA